MSDETNTSDSEPVDGAYVPGVSVEDAYTVSEADHRLPDHAEEISRARSEVFGGDVETDFDGAQALAEQGQRDAAEAADAEESEAAMAEPAESEHDPAAAVDALPEDSA